MGHSRRWISREEIAEIHDAIASKAADDSNRALADHQYGKAGDDIAHCSQHLQAANMIREIDHLDRVTGRNTEDRLRREGRPVLPRNSR
jgi:hypothetical protein